MEKKTTEKLQLKWMEREPNEAERVGAMYCFKFCDINVN